MLFFFHWYDGELPPLLGVAINVTEVPGQIAPIGFAAIVTEGVTFEFTVTIGSVPVLLLAPCEAVLKVILLKAKVVQMPVVAVILDVKVILR